MNQSDIAHALEDCDLFKDLKKDNIKRIAGLCRMVSYKPGQYVFRQGDFGKHLYVIADGHIFLERSVEIGPRKGRVVIGILGKGRVFGCWSTLLDEPHNLMCSAVCQKATKVLVIDGVDLRKEMGIDAVLGASILKKLCLILRNRLQDVFGAMEKV